MQTINSVDIRRAWSKSLHPCVDAAVPLPPATVLFDVTDDADVTVITPLHGTSNLPAAAPADEKYDFSRSVMTRLTRAVSGVEQLVNVPRAGLLDR